jgi:hypothetical protein
VNRKETIASVVCAGIRCQRIKERHEGRSKKMLADSIRESEKKHSKCHALSDAAKGVSRAKNSSEDHEEPPENCIHLSVFDKES